MRVCRLVHWRSDPAPSRAFARLPLKRSQSGPQTLLSLNYFRTRVKHVDRSGCSDVDGLVPLPTTEPTVGAARHRPSWRVRSERPSEDQHTRRRVLGGIAMGGHRREESDVAPQTSRGRAVVRPVAGSAWEPRYRKRP